MDIERQPIDHANPRCQAWRVTEDGKQYWVWCRRTPYGPMWTASVFVEPRGDQRPYWRSLKNWQRLAGECRAFENRN